MSTADRLRRVVWCAGALPTSTQVTAVVELEQPRQPEQIVVLTERRGSAQRRAAIIEQAARHGAELRVETALGTQGLAELRERIAELLSSPGTVPVRSAEASLAGSELDWLSRVLGLPVRVVDADGRVSTPSAPPLGLDRTEALRLVDSAQDGSPSALAKLLLRGALRHETLSAQPATAQFLAQNGYTDLATRLADLVGHWLTQRLWALNLVPELVAHDDRHAERVDRLITQLAGPLLLSGRLSAEELFWLSAAAWLHDWGHVGAALGWHWVDDPRDVRLLHGILSQQLLTKHYKAMHGLETDTAAKVGVLAAHHQGWTSFGNVAAARGKEHAAYRKYSLHDPKTLHEDAADVGLPAARADLLVALLRVADGADVGVHRIPDLAARTDFLDFCVQRRALDTATTLHLRHGDAAAQAVDAARLIAARPRDQLAQADLAAFAELRALRDYTDFIHESPSHYRKHAAVRHVRLGTADGRRFVPYVLPNADPADHEAASLALTEVAGDIQRELSRPGTRGARTVRRVLADEGIQVQTTPRLDELFT